MEISAPGIINLSISNFGFDCRLMHHDDGLSCDDHPSMRTMLDNLENGPEGSKIPRLDVRCLLARNVEKRSPTEPALSLEDFESGKIAPNPGWLKEVWGRWPGDESIEELLVALDDDSLERKSTDEE